jgi:hypothetical protein
MPGGAGCPAFTDLEVHMLVNAIALALGVALVPDTVTTNHAPTVRVDTSADAITITIGNLRIAGGGSYGAASEERVRFAWPSTGWMRGYRLDVLDSDGRLMPREALHHAGLVNPERRQLAYPLAERLIAAGRETAPVTLPGRLGVPMFAGQPLVAYFMLMNPTHDDLSGVSLRFTFPWTPASATRRPRDTFPLLMDANPAIGSKRTFDLPPGLSITVAEFTLALGGRLRAAGAHLHDYAVEIRLEDVASGKVLARVRPDRTADGRLRSIGVEKFLLTRGGLRLDEGRRYRVVAIYDNPTCDTITDGAMAFLAGPFIPDNASRWPAIDQYDPSFQSDAAVRAAPVAQTHDAHTGHAGHGVGVETTKAPVCREAAHRK